MYQLADKKKVMSLFHKGESVSQIRLKSNVSKSTLYRWKAEDDTTSEIKGYIKKGQLDRAKQIILQFQGEHRKTNELFTSKVIGQFIELGYLDEAKELAEDLVKKYPNDMSVKSQLITIAKQKADWKEVERLSREILALDPDNLPARSQLITIAKQKENWEEVERLSKEILALDPNNIPARSQLVVITKQRGDWEEVEKLCREILTLDSNDLPARKQLITITKQKGGWEEAERLCREILALNPNDLPARGQLVVIAKQKGDWGEVERLSRERLSIEPNNEIAKKQLKTSIRMQRKRKERKETSQTVQEKLDSNRQSLHPSVQMIRSQIQAGTFLLDNVEARKKEMQEMEIDEVQINLLLAEAYERQNLPKQTKEYLKKALQGVQDPKLQKAIKALIETAQTKKKKPSHINPWDSITITQYENNARQTTSNQKESNER